MLIKHIPYLFLIPLLTCGCIKDDRRNCITPTPPSPPSSLFTGEFFQTINDQEEDLIDEITDIRIYIFDLGTRLLHTIIEATPADIANKYVERQLPDGNYAMVAVGSRLYDMSAGSFKDAGAVGTDTDRYLSPVAIGQTTLDQFRFMLDYITLSGDPYAQIAPALKPMDSLYFSVAYGVVVRNDRNQTVGFDFRRNYATFNIMITGLSNLPEMTRATPPITTFITGRNASYDYLGNIDINSKLVRYDPISEDASRTDTVTYTIRTLRLEVNHDTDMPLMIYAKYPAQPPATGMIDLEGSPMNLTSLIKDIEEPPGSGSHPFENQDPIDRRSSFDVEINILPPGPVGQLGIKVRINDWDVTPLIPIT
jgi:hypothetical protein